MEFSDCVCVHHVRVYLAKMSGWLCIIPIHDAYCFTIFLSIQCILTCHIYSSKEEWSSWGKNDWTHLKECRGWQCGIADQRLLCFISRYTVLRSFFVMSWLRISPEFGLHTSSHGSPCNGLESPSKDLLWDSGRSIPSPFSFSSSKK